jgi:sucrose-6-phosphate hydrolase SacC (GH32 family)
VDRSSVEALGQGGLVSITDRIYPPPGAQGVELYAKGGRAKLVTLNARKLKSAWR